MLRLVLAAVASRHKDVNERCRHPLESQTVPAPKGSGSYTAGNFLWLQNEEKSIQDDTKSKNTTSHSFQVHFKIMKNLYMAGNSNLHQKKAELSTVLCLQPATTLFQSLYCGLLGSGQNTPNICSN